MKDANRALVERYFESWQQPSDWDALRSCLSDDFVFDAGTDRISGADRLVDHLRQNEAPWRDVSLLGSVLAGDQAALFYQGVEDSTGTPFRVAELLEIGGARIRRARVVMVPLGRAPITP